MKYFKSLFIFSGFLFSTLSFCADGAEIPGTPPPAFVEEETAKPTSKGVFHQLFTTSTSPDLYGMLTFQHFIIKFKELFSPLQKKRIYSEAEKFYFHIREHMEINIKKSAVSDTFLDEVKSFFFKHLKTFINQEIERLTQAKKDERKARYYNEKSRKFSSQRNSLGDLPTPKHSKSEEERTVQEIFEFITGTSENNPSTAKASTSKKKKKKRKKSNTGSKTQEQPSEYETHKQHSEYETHKQHSDEEDYWSDSSDSEFNNLPQKEQSAGRGNLSFVVYKQVLPFLRERAKAQQSKQ